MCDCPNIYVWSNQKMFLLIKINARPIPGDLQHRSRTASHNCAMDENGHKAGEHDDDLEDVGPDHSFHSALTQTDDGGGHTVRQTTEKMYNTGVSTEATPVC